MRHTSCALGTGVRLALFRSVLGLRPVARAIALTPCPGWAARCRKIVTALTTAATGKILSSFAKVPPDLWHGIFRERQWQSPIAPRPPPITAFIIKNDYLLYIDRKSTRLNSSH